MAYGLKACSCHPLTTVAYQYSQEENYKDEDKSIGVSLRTDQESSGK